MPYTYLIGWTSLNKFYYGCRYAKNCRPDELWVNYFTSSKYVAWMREFYGEPNVIQIRKIFEDQKKCRSWESKVLTKLNVIYSDRWLNRTNNIAINPILAINFNRRGVNLTKETKLKLKLANIGKIHSNETKMKIGNKLKSLSNRKEINLKISAKLLGKPTWNKGLSYSINLDHSGPNNPMFGKIHSNETKIKMSESKKNKTWMNKNGSIKFIDNSKLLQYESIGWNYGRGPRK